MSGHYDDILNLPHPTSKKHPRMAAIDRAAQFSPFAALTGYEGAVKETARLTDKRMELDESELAAIDERLRMVLEWEGEPLTVAITYFQPDELKDGGAYITVSGFIKKVEELRRVLVMVDGREIAIDKITAIHSSAFNAVL